MIDTIMLILGTFSHIALGFIAIRISKKIEPLNIACRVLFWIGILLIFFTVTRLLFTFHSIDFEQNRTGNSMGSFGILLIVLAEMWIRKRKVIDKKV